jgi:hypothetical protein
MLHYFEPDFGFELHGAPARGCLRRLVSHRLNEGVLLKGVSGRGALEAAA